MRKCTAIHTIIAVVVSFSLHAIPPRHASVKKHAPRRENFCTRLCQGSHLKRTLVALSSIALACLGGYRYGQQAGFDEGQAAGAIEALRIARALGAIKVEVDCTNRDDVSEHLLWKKIYEHRLGEMQQYWLSRSEAYETELKDIEGMYWRERWLREKNQVACSRYFEDKSTT